MEISLHKIVYDNTLILLVGFHTFQKLAFPEDFLIFLKEIGSFLSKFKTVCQLGLCLYHYYHSHSKNGDVLVSQREEETCEYNM